MFFLLLMLFPFDQLIVRLSLKLKPLVSRIPIAKYADVCRVYELLLRLRHNQKRRRKLLEKMNMCSYATRWVDLLLLVVEALSTTS